MGDIDIVPVVESDIEPLEDAPDKDREGDHHEKGAGPGEEEGFTLDIVDQGVGEQDIGPPGETVEIGGEGFCALVHHHDGQDEGTDTDGTVDLNPCAHVVASVPSWGAFSSQRAHPGVPR